MASQEGQEGQQRQEGRDCCSWTQSSINCHQRVFYASLGRALLCSDRLSFSTEIAYMANEPPAGTNKGATAREPGRTSWRMGSDDDAGSTSGDYKRDVTVAQGHAARLIVIRESFLCHWASPALLFFSTETAHIANCHQPGRQRP